MNKNRSIPDGEISEVFASAPHTNRRSCEKHLMALIILGNPPILKEHLADHAEALYGPIIVQPSDASPTQTKYQILALTDHASRAAIEAGVAESAVRAISDSCKQLVSATDDPEMQQQLISVIVTRFCEEVYAARVKDLSPAVKQCSEYIHAKVRSALTLSELGQVCHLSPHYVSDLFRKEMGFGALQYAHQIKLQYAKYLLEHSDISLADLSSQLSYPSHSNFSHRFKKTYGITPHEYRRIFRQ